MAADAPDAIMIGDFVEDLISKETGCVIFININGEVILDCFPDSAEEPYTYVVPSNHPLRIIKDDNDHS